MASYDSLWHIVSSNQPNEVIIPPGEKIYPIDLENRTIDGPDFVGIREEHDAELIYFKAPRFYDLVDLSNTACIIQYETINKNNGETFQGIYFVSAYDKTTFKDCITFAWDISKSVTQSATDIKYNIRFFQVNDNNEIIFNLNTLATTTKVLDSLYFSDFEDLSKEETTKWAELYEQMAQLYKKVSESERIYWEEA